MKRSAITITAAAALMILALTGCSTPAAPEPPAKATPTVPAIDPGPVDLTVEQASERYLSIVCPTNFGAKAYNAAFKAGEDEYLNGGAPDPTAVKDASTKFADLTRATVGLLDDEYFVWPSKVGEQIPHMRASYMGQLTASQAAANAATFEEAYNVPLPVTTPEQDTAGQEIRLQLDLPSDTMASCAGFEDGHTKLTAEQTEREAALAKQE